jgi:hypothetical protein
VTKNKSAGTIALALSVTLADCKALLQLADEALYRPIAHSPKGGRIFGDNSVSLQENSVLS